MSADTLAKLQAAFKKSDKQGSSRPNNYYPFWNIPEGGSATVRFLPDGNKENELGFVVEKVMHNLEINGERKSVPCLSMFGEECPICKVSQAYYKQEDRENGSKYWKKKQHIAQALILEDPLPADQDSGETHDGKIRFLAIGFQLFNIIKQTFEDGELDDIPYDYQNGTNFIIKKTKQGAHAAYNLSKFARKSTALTEDQYALAQDQLIDLSTLLPKNPGLDKVEGMLEASLTGGTYDDGSSSNASVPSAAAKAQSSTPVAESKPAAPADDSSDDDGEFDDEAKAILARIQGRPAASAE